LELFLHWPSCLSHKLFYSIYSNALPSILCLFYNSFESVISLNIFIARETSTSCTSMVISQIFSTIFEPLNVCVAYLTFSPYITFNNLYSYEHMILTTVYQWLTLPIQSFCTLF
jgi:hypothetical protein